MCRVFCRLNLLFLVYSIALGKTSPTSLVYDYIPGQIVIKTAENVDVLSVPELTSKIDLIQGMDKAVSPVFNSNAIKPKLAKAAQAIGLPRVYKVNVTKDTDIPRLCRELNRHKGIIWAEPVYIIPQHVQPNDPYYTSKPQTHLPQMQMEEAWNEAKGDSTVPIAILDSGIDFLHPDLESQIWINPGEFPIENFPNIDANGDGIIELSELKNWSYSDSLYRLQDFNEDGLTNIQDLFTPHANNLFLDSVDNDDNSFTDDFIGWDFVAGVSGSEETDAVPDEDSREADNIPMDVNGHGSHCAGLAAAATNNGIGVASVSWGCKIMPIRIGWQANDGNGYGNSVWMSQAFIYAADNGAKVASLSYGNSAVVLEGARYAFLHDVAVLTSAGNDNTNMFDPLSLAPWVITVAAVDPYDVKAQYSNYGIEVTVTAPGGDHNPGLWSTTPKNQYNNDSHYNAYSGTSMASPVTAGLLGLIRSFHPEWSVAQSYFQLAGTADNIDADNPDYSGMLGYGRINGYRALTETVVPKPDLALKYIEYSDPSGNDNGLVEPGENIEIVLHIENRWAGVADVTVTIDSDDERINPVTASVQFDTLYGLEDYPADNNNATEPLIVHIAENLSPQNITLTLNLENPSFSDTFLVNIPVHPLVLFVDDHLGGSGEGNMPIKEYYLKAFEKLGVAYEYWLNEEPPDSAYIAKFPIVVWGCEWAFPSLTTADRNVLSYYLENGGNLFISGQDIGWDLCDASATNNQHYATEGESKTWYETYLASQYLSDGGGRGPLTPTDDTTFFSLPSFDFLQPGREEYIYPSEIEPTEKGFSVLEYKNGQSAAVASVQPYNTVYFAFAGWEAISDSTIRLMAMQQLLNHFVQLDAEVTWLYNTENKGPFEINVQLNNEKVMTHTELWYRYNEADWTTLTMKDLGSGRYSAKLPADTSDCANIDYFVFLKADDGMYYVNPIHRFFSGPDQIAPFAQESLLPQDNIDPTGPYYCEVELFDNMTIDTSNVRVHFSTASISEDSTYLDYHSGHIWAGTFQFDTPIPDGDSVLYYFTFNDLSSAEKHYSRYPENGYLTFKIVQSAVLDDFEAGLTKWNNDDRVWQIFTNEILVHSGISCLITGNETSYPPSTHTNLESVVPLNLRSRNTARIQFWATNMFEQTSDSAFFEIREGDGEWQTLQTYARIWSNWKPFQFDLTPHCGPEHQPVYYRFRFKSDDNTIDEARFGIKIDLLEILVDDAVAIESTPENIPLSFDLLPAYPNPFNAIVTIPYTLPAKGEVKMVIYDLRGNQVYSRQIAHTIPGSYQWQWNGKSKFGTLMPSGLYFVRAQYNQRIKTSKVVLMK